ncbi:MAG: hypothetical protein U0984_00870 [Prosthecobacter sp.]|nr:hypothetical protein [Prosthecobacter sp.]
MSDDPNQRGAADRSRVALGEDYEVQYFVEAMQKHFPSASGEQIKRALVQARQASGGSVSREVLTEKVKKILGKK